MASSEVGVMALANLGAKQEDECDGPANPALALKEMEVLEAIKEDICKWFAEIMHLEISPDSFMKDLENGVTLCKLATLIQEAANRLKNSENKAASSIPVPYKEGAKEGSFQARDNTTNFINWCRKLGVEEAVIFESEGLVLHRDQKRVILCLLDVARFAGRVGLPTPQLVRMEKEIEELDMTVTNHSESADGNSMAGSESKSLKIHLHSKQTELSKKVLEVLSRCSCSNQRLEANDCGSGKFIVKGGNIRTSKVLYARLLKDRIMVRVGGGWDTLDHFLLVHDPCRVQQFISLKEGPNN